jgi:putative membrane protein
MVDLRGCVRLAATLGVCVSLVACAEGDGGEATDTTAAGGAVDTAGLDRSASADWSDAEILGYLAAADNAEIAVSGLGVRRATNRAVKQFAQHMLDEHTASRSEGQQLAQRLNINPTTRQDFDVREDAADVIGDLEDDQAGKEFDEGFIRKQIELHDKVLDKLDDFRNSAQNAELRQLLERLRPRVEQHKQRAEQIKDTRV